MPDATHRAELQTMLEAHCRNIDLVESSLSGDAAPGPATTPRNAYPTEAPVLIDHILQRFHEVHRRQLPELIGLATKVEAAHAEHPDAPRGLATLLLQILRAAGSHGKGGRRALPDAGPGGVPS
jgi:regulator of cell morphogenesis and NO signaling